MEGQSQARQVRFALPKIGAGPFQDVGAPAPGLEVVVEGDGELEVADASSDTVSVASAVPSDVAEDGGDNVGTGDPGAVTIETMEEDGLSHRLKVEHEVGDQEEDDVEISKIERLTRLEAEKEGAIRLLGMVTAVPDLFDAQDVKMVQERLDKIQEEQEEGGTMVDAVKYMHHIVHRRQAILQHAVHTGRLPPHGTLFDYFVAKQLKLQAMLQ